MLLGVIFYRPVFQNFIDAATPFNGVQGKNHRPDRKTVSLINNNTDTVVTTKTFDYAEMDLKFNVGYTDTFYAGHLKPAGHSKPEIKDRKLGLTLFVHYTLLVFVMIIFVTMVYGPMAAFLVELFPTRIRYTSMSLPYHIGNGVFGGLVPFIATLLSTTFTNDPLVGLWYPIGVAALCFVIGALYLSNRIDKNVND